VKRRLHFQWASISPCLFNLLKQGSLLVFLSLFILEEVFFVDQFLALSEEFRHSESVNACVGNAFLQVLLLESGVVLDSIPLGIHGGLPSFHAI